MILLVDGQRVDSRSLPLLGEGGEARVLEHQGRALKLWHQPDPARWRKLQELPTGLPTELVLPQDPVLGEGGELIGFRMEKLDSLGSLRDLARPSWRKARGFDASRIGRLFERLLGVLEACHRKGLVFGDLNDGNVLLTARGPRFIDLDSAQHGGHPCPVGHERFLAPELFDLDLAAAPVFSPSSDHYALAVLLFQALLSVHPYGGVHPSWSTLVQRARAGVSLLSPGVKRPPIAQDPEILPDPLRDFFLEVFERGGREALPRPLLRDLHLSGSSPKTPALRVAGRLQSELLARSSGLFLAVRGGPRLRHLRWEEGALIREHGQRLACPELPPGLVVGLDGGRSWLALGEQVRDFEGQRLQTSRFMGRPQLAVSQHGALVLHQGQLLRSDGRRLGRASAGRSWLAHGEHFGLVLSRYGFLSTLSVLRGGLLPAELPPFPGALLELDASFDKSSALLNLRLDHAGRQQVLRVLLDDRGRLLASSRGVEDSAPQHAWVPSLLRGTRVLLASPEGLLRLEARSGALEPTRLLPDSADLLRGARALVHHRGGAFCLVTHQEIRRISIT